MDTILADLSISLSDFKKNPSKVVREAGSKPVAVLNHNKPAFYLVEPHVFEVLLDRLDDEMILPLVHERLLEKDSAIVVDINNV